jgi:hypothetical protein
MIKILKSGSWALEGVNVVDMVEGAEGNFGSSENCKLVDAGWAEWVKVEPKAKAEAQPEVRKARAK